MHRKPFPLHSRDTQLRNFFPVWPRYLFFLSWPDARHGFITFNRGIRTLTCWDTRHRVNENEKKRFMKRSELYTLFFDSDSFIIQTQKKHIKLILSEKIQLLKRNRASCDKNYISHNARGIALLLGTLHSIPALTFSVIACRIAFKADI